jgi:hypothetical protein
VLTAEDVAAVAKIELRYKTFFGADTVREALDCFIVTLVDICKRSAANGARVDEVKW